MKAQISDSLLNEALAQPTPELAAYKLLYEGIALTRGTKVAVLSDEIYALEGLTVTVVGPSDKGGEFVDVETASGMKVPIISTLLLPV
jgi:hypothetical protein